MSYALNSMAVDGAGRHGDDILRLEADPAEKNAGLRPVVFVLPGLGGEEDPELEAFWGPTRPILDLVPVAYLDWTELLETGRDFSVLAARVLQQIESRMPTGPIHMAGYSIGGHLAFNSALALQAKGRLVESIAILDAPVHVGDFTPSFRNRMKGRLEQLLAFNPRAALASLCTKVLIRDRARPLLYRLSRYRQVALPFRFDKYLHHKITMQMVRRIYPVWWDTRLHRTDPLSAPTWLFRSEEHQPGERADLGWSDYCRNLQVVPVAGSHRGMLHPSINGPLRAAFVEAMTAARDKS